MAWIESHQSNGSANKKNMKNIKGTYIVVIAYGWVYAGKVSVKGGMLYIANAKNIRRWGTPKGLGGLANGPLPATKADQAGEVLVPLNSVIHLIACAPASW